jgi:glycosyltransferase involved in cell wall biosynthesis
MSIATTATNWDGPSVSIGLPVYNSARTLENAIRSILWQTYPHWTLWIIDDGSTDQTCEIARSFSDPRIRIIADGAHRGLPARLNQAVWVSQGRYFARMDSDDIAYPERLERQVDFLEENLRVDLLGTGILVFKGDGEAMGIRLSAVYHEGLCTRPWAGIYLPHPTWMGRLSWFRKNPYRTDAVRMEDQELLLRTYTRSTFANLPEILLGYRENSFSLRKAALSRYHLAKMYARRGLTASIDPLLALRGIANHAAKAAVETLAVATGMNYSILRHRAVPADGDALAQWNALWSRLTTRKRDRDASRRIAQGTPIS